MNDFNLQTFPNPVSSELTIKTTEGKQGDLFIISDVTGRIVKTVEFAAEQMTIDLSTLEDGIYFIRLNNGAGKKIIKAQK